MIDFERKKYPLCYCVPYENESGFSYGSHRVETKYEYIATDGTYVYRLGEKKYSKEFKQLNQDEPRIQLTRFEGCFHWYGKMYMPNGDCYELQCVITDKYLSDAHEIRGDWSGYRKGDTTARFLSKASIMSAFELFKNIVK